MDLLRSSLCGWTLIPPPCCSTRRPNFAPVTLHDVRPLRSVRKAIFSLRLWLPACQQRSHSQRQRCPRQAPGSRKSVSDAGLTFACVNACSVGNKSATLSRLIVDEQLDVLAITETWHERSDSAELRRLTPPGYRCIDAARPIPPGANVDTLG